MWLITTRGFYSVVQHRGLPDYVRVRARTREDLERLLELPEMQPYVSSVEEDLDADYRYRIPRVARADWSGALLHLTEEIDYDNFKEAAKKVDPRRGPILARVWSALRQLQPIGKPRKAEKGRRKAGKGA